MSARARVKRYREEGGAADLVRLEVLVAPADREAVLALAKHLREAHRAKKRAIEAAIRNAVDKYRVRVLDNVDLDRIRDVSSKARIVAGALMERGDARAFVMGRKLLDQVKEANLDGAH